jgi:hypothetical protein
MRSIAHVCMAVVKPQLAADALSCTETTGNQPTKDKHHVEEPD